MADIRTLFTRPGLVAVAAAAPPAGFTAAREYPVVSLGIDCAPAAPVLYALLVTDAGALVASQAGGFTFVLRGRSELV